jgi:hypothetical protein
MYIYISFGLYVNLVLIMFGVRLTNTQCLLGTTEAYWSDHKLIYFAYKLANHITNFILH